MSPVALKPIPFPPKEFFIKKDGSRATITSCYLKKYTMINCAHETLNSTILQKKHCVCSFCLISASASVPSGDPATASAAITVRVSNDEAIKKTI